MTFLHRQHSALQYKTKSKKKIEIMTKSIENPKVYIKH